jgi:hypothetical protein
VVVANRLAGPRAVACRHALTAAAGAGEQRLGVAG